MLKMDDVRFTGGVDHRPVAPNQLVVDEGHAMVYVDNGSGGTAVKMSEGTAGEIFAGFSIFNRRVPSVIPAVIEIVGRGEAFTVPLPGWLTGTHAISSKVGGAAAEVTVAAGVATVAATLAAGVVVQITYSKSPTVAELMSLQGHVQPASPLETGAECGLIRNGLIYTSAFVTSDAWTVNAIPKLGSGGRITLAGSGVAIPGARVEAVPNASNPFLGISIIA